MKDFEEYKSFDHFLNFID